MKVQAAALVLALSLWSIAAVQALDPPSSSLSSSSSVDSSSLPPPPRHPSRVRPPTLWETTLDLLNNDDGDDNVFATPHMANRRRIPLKIAMQIIFIVLSATLHGDLPFLLRCETRGPQLRRVRKSFEDIESNLSDKIFRRVYRMKRASFYRLHAILQPRLGAIFFPGGGGDRGTNSEYNINTKLRLSMAIRYFAAGGCPLDIMQVHGVTLTSVYASVWGVVDAINSTSVLGYPFPSHERQSEIAKGFCRMSRAGFDKVIGALDGLVICTLRPSLSECRAVNCGQVISAQCNHVSPLPPSHLCLRIIFPD